MTHKRGSRRFTHRVQSVEREKTSGYIDFTHNVTFIIYKLFMNNHLQPLLSGIQVAIILINSVLGHLYR